MPLYDARIFGGRASQYLVKEIVTLLDVPLGKLDISQFQDGEIEPAFKESIRGKDVFIVQSTFPPADNIWELLLIIDAAKRASAHSITVAMPYYGYARQDRKSRPRVSIGARVLADMISRAGATRLVTMDLHAGQIQGFFDIPVDNLAASAVFVPYIQKLNLTDLVIVSPDSGGAKRARNYARWLDGGLAIIEKFRTSPNEIASMNLIGEVKNKNVVIVDDIVDTAGTLCKAISLLKEHGAKSIYAMITHPLLSGNALERIKNAPIDKLVVTNTIPVKKTSEKLEIISIAPIFARAFEKIINLESVSSLFLE